MSTGDAMADRADLAIRLVEERTRLGYSQADFASKAGVSREGLRLYESGQRGMAAEFLAEAAELGVDVQYVLCGVKSKNLADLSGAAAPVQVNGNAVANVVGSVHSGGVVHQIHTQHHVTKTIAEVRPGEEHISDEQAAVLTGLVNAIVDKEAVLKTDPKTHRAVWSSLNAHCSVTRYRLIKSTDFERARKYLDQWMGRLNSMATAPRLDGDAWRKRRYAYIKINSKSDVDEAAVAAYIKRNFRSTSISELSNDQLEQVYRYVAARRSRQKRH